MREARLLGLLLAGAALAAPAAAHAFCGFYVSGAGADLFNNATQVVLMRQGTRTVLSMQNNYQGPPSDFAMVVPVPIVLEKENVKTLPKEVFSRVDKLSAPRLVEYWEQDPCARRELEKADMAVESSAAPAGGAAQGRDLGVKIEAQFKVAEYDIVILSARDSTGLDTWLRQENYKIPAGAEPYLKPYVQSGSKFFVAKVDAKKVRFENGQAMLSPLRFHYDAEEFTLPIRLGMMNSSGKQDLIVNILAPGQRYEVSNYQNVTIPTNLDVAEDARSRFGEFYAALFDRTLELNRGAVVTEYSWDAGSCDPCPEPPLEPAELTLLGGDVVRGGGAGDAAAPMMYGFVLTRLHARYAKGGISEDLVFKAAPPIAGGREMRGSGLLSSLTGSLEKGAVESSVNNFQGRYAIRHEWTGPITCANPERGIWGGPPGQQIAAPVSATNLAFVPRGKLRLSQIVRRDVPEIALVAEPRGGSPAPQGEEKPRTQSPKKEKGCAMAGAGGSPALMLLVAAALWLVIRRRRS